MSSSRTWPEESLVRRCVEGERMAWRVLHRRYEPIARAFLRRLGVRATELDDICQDVFLRMFRALPKFRGEAELKTWLYRLCVTEARRARRHTSVAQALRKLLLTSPPERRTTGLELTGESASRKLQLGLSSLKEAERAVFVMYELEGIPGKQIAEVLSCPEATVWRRLHYARQAFCAALEAQPMARGES
jgi:RNA polymerase sigma-70 factor, ECF subfamily